MRNDVPNTFITENGEIFYINEFHWTDRQLDHIAEMETTRYRIEQRYQTNDVYEMMKKGIKLKELMRYLSVRHDLMYLYGIE